MKDLINELEEKIGKKYKSKIDQHAGEATVVNGIIVDFETGLTTVIKDEIVTVEAVDQDCVYVKDKYGYIAGFYLTQFELTFEEIKGSNNEI